MRLTWKAAVALVIGGIALGGVASSYAADEGRRGSGPPRKAFMIHHGPLVRSTTVVEGDTEGTFQTLQDDAGELASVSGNTLTVKQADGKSVEIAVSDETRYMRDREEATLADLEVGDHVFVHRVDDVTEHVGAISAEEWERMQAEREACEQDPESCPRRHHMGPPPGARGDVEPAPAPANEASAAVA